MTAVKKLIIFLALLYAVPTLAQDATTALINAVIGTKTIQTIKRGYMHTSNNPFSEDGWHNVWSYNEFLYHKYSNIDKTKIEEILKNPALSANDIRLAWAYSKEIENLLSQQIKTINPIKNDSHNVLFLKTPDNREKLIDQPYFFDSLNERKAITKLLEDILEKREKPVDRQASARALNNLVNPQQPSDILSNKQATQDDFRIAWAHSYYMEKQLKTEADKPGASAKTKEELAKRQTITSYLYGALVKKQATDVLTSIKTKIKGQ